MGGRLFTFFFNHGNESAFQKSKLRWGGGGGREKTGHLGRKTGKRLRIVPHSLKPFDWPLFSGVHIPVLRGSQTIGSRIRPAKALDTGLIRQEYNICMYDMFKEIKGNVEHMSEGQKYVLKILYIYI